MSCCGQHRETQGATASAVHPSSVASPLKASVQPSLTTRGSMWGSASLALAGRGVQLRYRDRAPVQVRGPATGRTYVFSAVQPVQVVDARDADGLLRTRMFLRAV
jgi:hypothetical protein